MKLFGTKHTSMDIALVVQGSNECDNDIPLPQSKIQVDRLQAHLERSSLPRLDKDETGRSENDMCSNMDSNIIFGGSKESEITKEPKVRRASKAKDLESFVELKKAAGDSRRNLYQDTSKRRGNGAPKTSSGIRNNTGGKMVSSNLPPKNNSHSTVMRSSSRRQLLAKSVSQGALLLGAKQTDHERTKRSDSHISGLNQQSSRRIHHGRSRKDLMGTPSCGQVTLTPNRPSDANLKIATQRRSANKEKVDCSPNANTTTAQNASRRCHGKKDTHKSRAHNPRVSILETISRSNRRSSAPKEANRESLSPLLAPNRGAARNSTGKRELDLKSLASLQRRSTRNLMVDPQDGTAPSRLLQQGSSCRGFTTTSGLSQRNLCSKSSSLTETLNKSCSLLNNSSYSGGIVIPMVITPKKKNQPTSKIQNFIEGSGGDHVDLGFNDSANFDLLSVG